MFTGIIQNTCPVIALHKGAGFMTLTLDFSTVGTKDLVLGASVAINGVCLTVTAIENDQVTFHLMQETLERTQLGTQEVNSEVNIERSATFASEIGGHILSGHIHGTTTITKIEYPNNNVIIHMHIPVFLKNYLFSKGYIALNGISLTIVAINHNEATFTVHLIPETLKRTIWSKAKVGDPVNVEIHSHTQIIVDTIEQWLLTHTNETKAFS